jgi:hypothetical protein
VLRQLALLGLQRVAAKANVSAVKCASRRNFIPPGITYGRALFLEWHIFGTRNNPLMLLNLVLNSGGCEFDWRAVVGTCRSGCPAIFLLSSGKLAGICLHLKISESISRSSVTLSVTCTSPMPRRLISAPVCQSGEL